MSNRMATRGPPRRTPNQNKIKGPNLVGMYSILKDGSISCDLSQLRYMTGNTDITNADLTIHDETPLEDLKNSNDDLKLEYDSDLLNAENLDKVKKQIVEDVESGEIKKYISSPFKKYLVDHPKILHERSAANINDVQIFTSKEAIRKMAVLRYENCYNYFTACLAGGIIYIDHYHESQFELSGDSLKSVKKNDFKEDQYKNKGKKWGYVFEDYMLSDHPGKEPDPKIFQGGKRSFVCTYDIEIFEHKIHYWSELDGIMPPKDHSILSSDDEETLLNEMKKMELVEVKTCLRAEDSNAFRYNKCRETWLQGTLGKVDKVVIGFRREDGILTCVKKYSLPELAKKASGWTPTGLQFGIKDFLDSVKKTFQKIIQDIDYSTFKGDIKNLPPISIGFMTSPKCNEVEMVLVREIQDMKIERAFELFLVVINGKEHKKIIDHAIKYAFESRSNEENQFENDLNDICKKVMAL